MNNSELLAAAILLNNGDLAKQDQEAIERWSKWLVNKLIANKITDKQYIYNYVSSMVDTFVNVSKKWLSPGYSTYSYYEYVEKVSKLQANPRYFKWCAKHSNNSTGPSIYNLALEEFGKFLLYEPFKYIK